MTIPIYVAAVIVLVLVAYFSDRAGDRSLYVIGSLVVGLVGYIGFLAIPKDGSAAEALYAMLFLVAAGLYAIVCGTVAWTGKPFFSCSYNCMLTMPQPTTWPGRGNGQSAWP